MTNAIILPLRRMTAVDLTRLIVGYTTDSHYVVARAETVVATAVTLTLTPLPAPQTVRYHHLDADTIAQYQALLAGGLSFGAYAGGRLVGLALGEAETWNGSLWLRELHVAESHRGQGLGRQLVEAAAAAGHDAGLRVLVCETQTTNAPAIAFYRHLGFHLDGIDLSYYSNDDYADGQVAVFMKRPLPP